MGGVLTSLRRTRWETTVGLTMAMLPLLSVLIPLALTVWGR